jgi:uncharacterized protein
VRKILKTSVLILLFIFVLTSAICWFLYQDPIYIFKGKVTVEKIKLNSDKDKDGILDLDDILEGAKKELDNHPRYKSVYYEGGYPPENEGVCTDVIWRALRNAGFDLKQLMDEDISQNIKQYPWINEKPDPNIDFRRVKNQLVYFRKFAQNLTTEVIPFDKENLKEWQAGDIVVLEKTDHIAVISDKRRNDGVPYIIHNASTYPKEDNKLMKWYKSKRIVAHFRFPKAEELNETN